MSGLIDRLERRTIDPSSGRIAGLLPEAGPELVGPQTGLKLTRVARGAVAAAGHRHTLGAATTDVGALVARGAALRPGATVTSRREVPTKDGRSIPACVRMPDVRRPFRTEDLS